MSLVREKICTCIRYRLCNEDVTLEVGDGGKKGKPTNTTNRRTGELFIS